MKNAFFDILLYLSLVLNVFSCQKCKRTSMEDDIKNSDIIITGMVQELETTKHENKYGALVSIHRVIKRQDIMIFNESINRSLVEKSFKNSSSNLQAIYINNFGNSLVCDSDVNINDVGVFLLKVDAFNRVYLSSSLVRFKLAKSTPLISEAWKSESNVNFCIIRF